MKKNKWHPHYDPNFENNRKPKKDEEKFIQKGLFNEIPINESIFIKKFQEKQEEISKDKSLNDEKNNNGQTEKQIKIYHRKNFGIVQTHISELLDKRTDPKGGKCSEFCQKGLKWVYYGMINTIFAGHKSRKNTIYPHKGVPSSVYDVLNESEIFAFYAAIWLGKYLRDNATQASRLATLLAIDRIDKEDGVNLIYDIITTGQALLAPHWKFEEINKSKNSNPYPSSYESLIERIQLIPEEDISLVKKILKTKFVIPRFQKFNIIKVNLDGITTETIEMIRMFDIFNAWKEKEGKHYKRKDLREMGINTEPVDERRCANFMQEYFAKKDEEWKAWRSGIETI